MHQYTEFGTIT